MLLYRQRFLMSERYTPLQSPETHPTPSQEEVLDIQDTVPETQEHTDPARHQTDQLDTARTDIEAIMKGTDMPETQPTLDTRPTNPLTPERTYKGTDREHLARPSDIPVEVDGRIMNVNVQGDGNKVIVLLQGRGTTAPALDFAPLIDELKRTYKVVTPELFGSGLSDMTDKPRTKQLIAAELHEALQQVGVHEYILVGHSLAGTQALELAEEFPDEMKGFVGIDTATPHMSQFTTKALERESSIPRKPLAKRIADKVGLTRLASKVMPSLVIGNLDKEVVGHKYSRREKAIMRELYFRNKDTDDTFEDMKEERKPDDINHEPVQFPDSMPVHFFLSNESVDLTDRTSPEPWYIREHEKQIPNPRADHASVTVLTGEHYLHHTQAAAIAQGIRAL